MFTGWFACACMMTVLYLIQRRTRDAGTMDVGWAAGVGLLAIFFAVVSSGELWRRILIATLACIWSLRLAGYLFIDRVWKARAEDGRYHRLRNYWGSKAQLGFFFFFQMQAVWSLLFALPLWVAYTQPRPGWGGWDILGVVVWLVAIVGESLADRQLAQWRRDPVNRGKSCRRGLWRYSRHPNYFFEFIHWFAYALFAMGAPHGWVAWLGPVVMLLFLHRVTGIPHTERQAIASRGDDYLAYRNETSAFFPWKPKTARR